MIRGLKRVIDRGSTIENTFFFGKIISFRGEFLFRFEFGKIRKRGSGKNKYNILGNQSLRETDEVENYLALFWWKIFFTKMNNSFFYSAVQRKINILKVLSEILNIAKINSFLTRH